MSFKYYFEGTSMEKEFPTLWHGYFLYNGPSININTNPEYREKSNTDLDDILTEICDINFYVHLEPSHIYISLCRDEKYYVIQFEKNISEIVSKINGKFNIKIYLGEFKAFEQRHNGNQYKYNLTISDLNKISLKKKVLNWDVVEKKQKIDDIENISRDISKIKINII